MHTWLSIQPFVSSLPRKLRSQPVPPPVLFHLPPQCPAPLLPPLSTITMATPTRATTAYHRNAVLQEEEDEERGWSDEEAGFSDEAEDEQEWAGGNGAARGEDLGADAGEDLSGWARQWPRPRELFVCNLPRRCDVQDLLELFTPHGTVLSVEVCSMLCDSTVLCQNDDA